VGIIELMNILYKLGSGLNAIILTLTLFLFGLMLAISGSFGSPQPAKDALAESGIYQTFVGEAVDDAGGTIEGLINADPEIRNVIINAALPYVQEDMEQGLDSLFTWLKDTSQPVTFTIDAKEAQEPVSQAVGNYVADDIISGLPTCISIPASFNAGNPFTWSCQPSNLNAESYRASFTEIVSNNQFWDETTFTLDDIAGVSEEELTEDYQVAANLYSASQTSTWLLGGIVLLSIVTTWLLAPSLRNTLRRVGISFMVVGIVLLGLAFGGAAILDTFLADFSSSDALEIASASIIENIGNHILGWWRWSGIIGGVLGLVLIISSLFIKGRFSKPTPNDPDLMGVDQS
jgi:hypothetical protein